MSDSLKHNRFKGADWFNDEPITLVLGGAGGISSWTALLLTRANFAPVIYDADIYEEHNMSGQFVSYKNIGMSKVESLAKDIERFTGETLTIFNEWFDINSMSDDIMVSGFDNMNARKVFFENWYNHVQATPIDERYKCILVDGRLLAEQYQILAVTGNDEVAIDKYKSDYLFGDDEVEEVLCTLKQTSHIAAMIAARITSIVTNHVTNVKFKRKIRKIPFFFEEYAPLLLITERKSNDTDSQSI